MSRQQTSTDPHGQDIEEEVVSGAGDVDENMEEAEGGYSSSTPSSTLTWISWFCSLPGHEYFCEVKEEFIEDDFNLTGLSAIVPFWKEAMEMVLDVEPDEDATKIPDVSIVESSAEMLYGLVHQRYVLTRVGLEAMVEKYENGVFGQCPRVYCNGMHVVPCGRADLPGVDTVKLFCPNCNDIYTPPSSRYQGVDGAYFGSTFAHLFFQSYCELMPAPFWKAPSPNSVSSSVANDDKSVHNPNPYGGQRRPEGYVYVPRIYGFKVSERAKSGPRMQWMRLRPESPAELDMVDYRGKWIDEDDEYDPDDEDEDGDRPMEDFDQDGEGDDDDGEEEEEEEDAAHASAPPVPGSSPHRKRPTEPPTTNAPAFVVSSTRSVRTTPTSKTTPRIPIQDSSIPPPISASRTSLPGAGKVRPVKQWAPRADVVSTCV